MTPDWEIDLKMSQLKDNLPQNWQGTSKEMSEAEKEIAENMFRSGASIEDVVNELVFGDVGYDFD